MCELFDHIYVSTDDYQISQVAKDYGAEVPFLRPNYCSTDTALDSDVRQHFLDWAATNEIAVNYLCYLYPTAPFVSPTTLINCFDTMLKNQAYMVQTITSFAYPIQRALCIGSREQIEFKWKEYADKRSQELTEYMHDAGQCYFFNLTKSANRDLKLGYRLPRKYVQDIDTFEDFEFAEFLFQHHILLKKHGHAGTIY